MEVCAPCDKVISESIIFNCLASDIENCITEHLHINDAQESVSMKNDDAINNVRKGEPCPVEYSRESSALGSSFNSVMLHLRPISYDLQQDKAEMIPETDIQEPAHDDGQSESSTLVSALKGSREKQGLSRKKLTVTWAPDVYDPTPTSVSHLVTRGKNKQRLNNKRNNSKKKNGKNKQKGNTSRGSGSGGKEKKHSRKVGIAAYDRFMEPSYQDFEVGSPSLDYCVSGFLVQSLTKVHYSTAEAL